MNSDPSQPAPAPAKPPSASNRTSNLKSRWKRSPGVGAVVQKAASPAVCGEVTDVANARESLSGEHVKGYERPAAPAPRPAAPAAPSAPAATPPARVETSTETHWTEPAQYDPPARAARVESAPPRPIPTPPPPTARVEPAPMHRPPPRDFSSAPPRPRDSAPVPPRELTSSRPREYSAEPRRDGAAQNRPTPSRPPQDGRDGRGDRDQYVALKPDPANDAAPRRLRTEAPQPMPVQEYKPSSFGRTADKSPSGRREHDLNRRDADSRSGDRDRPKPNAVISAHVAKEDDEPIVKPKSGGILGFIKRIFTGDPVPVKVKEAPTREREDDSRDGHRSGRDQGRGSDDGRHRHHHRHRGGQNRSSNGERRNDNRGDQRGESRGERRGDRRPDQR